MYQNPWNRALGRSLIRRFFLLGILIPTIALAGYEPLFTRVRDAAWAIYTRSTGGLSATCSASAFHTTEKFTYLLTAGHCFVGEDLRRTDFMATQDHRRFIPAKLVRSGLTLRRNASETSRSLDDYEGDDWAIVQIESGNHHTLPIGTSANLVVGEDLIMVGVPFGVDFLAVQGILGSKDLALSTLVWNHYYGANIYSAGGNSGTGVVSARQQALVGIINAGPGPQSNMVVFLPIDKIPAKWVRFPTQ